MKVYNKQLEFIDAKKKGIFCRYVLACIVPTVLVSSWLDPVPRKFKSLIKVIKFIDIAIEFYKILNLVYENNKLLC